MKISLGRKGAIGLFSVMLMTLPGARPAFGDVMRLEVLSFSYTKEPYTMRDADAQGGAMVSSDPVTGVSLNIQSVVNAYANIGKYEFWDWEEDARGKNTINWQMDLMLTGDPGASAEVLAEWDLWMAYMIGCEPDGLVPTGTMASVETSATLLQRRQICILGACFYIWEPRDDTAAYVGDLVLWLGVSGGGKEDTGHFSMGIHQVGKPFDIRGQYISDAWADENPWGRADSYAWGNYDLRLFVEPPPQPPDPSEIPEPASVALLGAVLGIVVFTRHRAGKGLLRRSRC